MIQVFGPGSACWRHGLCWTSRFSATVRSNTEQTQPLEASAGSSLLLWPAGESILGFNYLRLQIKKKKQQQTNGPTTGPVVLFYASIIVIIIVKIDVAN